MKKIACLTIFTTLIFTACNKDEVKESEVDNGTPIVKPDSTYTVLKEEDITYAEGLSHDETSTSAFAIPLKLDLYYPNNNSTNRPVFMFIHGGGFTSGIKDNPDIVNMANYYASRGWVFASIDYRTTEELGVTDEMTSEEVFTYYKGMAPQRWIDTATQVTESRSDFKKSITMYMAQRDSKAALRWIVSNSNTYNLNKDFITVGGASAGAITTIALGISDLEDFRDEITINDDPTLSSTNLNETYSVRSMVYFWGSNSKLDLHEKVYNLAKYDRYDANDPELFMAHGEATDPQTPYSEALELQDVYDSLGIYNHLATLMVPNPSNPSELVDAGHGAWDGEVDGKGIFELSFDFLVERQNLTVE